MDNKSTAASVVEEMVIKNSQTTDVKSSAKSVFRIQIASDLHLEHMQGPVSFDQLIQPDAPYLALLGDIGSIANGVAFGVYSKFLSQAAQKFDGVFVLAGNHEYYNSGGSQMTVDEINAKIEELCTQKPNLHFLNRSSVAINASIRVVGATLWSHVPPRATAEVTGAIGDYKRIYVSGSANLSKKKPDRRCITVADTNDMHATDVTFLKEQLKAGADAKQSCIVLTHHAPLLRGVSHPMYEPAASHPERLLNYAFCSALNYFFDHEKSSEYKALKLWGFGHTHFCTNQLMGSSGVKLVANQRGYEPDQINTDYKSACVLELPMG